MTSTVEYLGDLRTRATHLKSGQSFITDAPTDNEGKGEAFSPTDLCATSLATCMLTVMGISARNRNVDISGATAEVTKIMAADPRRIARVEIRLLMPPGAYTDVEKRVLDTAARTCPVALSLGEGVEQAIELVWL
ncbi:MAG: OsmC family protein [Saprospiraceae bacterium]